MVNSSVPEISADAPAAAHKAPWWELARRLEGGRLDSAEDGILVVAAQAGIAPQVAKRYVRLLVRMREIGNELGEPVESLLSPSFNAQEIAARLFARSRDEGTRTLKRIASAPVPIAELRDLLAQAKESLKGDLRSKIVSSRTAGTRMIESALRTGGAALFGGPHRLLRRPRLKFAGNMGYEIVAHEGAIVAGIDVLIPDPRLGHDALERDLSRSILLADFFRKFYLAFPASARPSASERVGLFGDPLDRVVDLLDWLKFDWIGVLVATDAETLEVVRPSEGRPSPNLSDRYGDYVRRYALAAANNPMAPKDAVHRSR
jgi:hypothetical protein